MDVAVASELGSRQKRNTDAYVSDVLTPRAVFLGVSDGFGPHEHGASPALNALEAVRDYLRGRRRLGMNGDRVASEAAVRALLLAALEHANARLYAQSGSHEDFVGSGASLTIVLIVDHHAFIGHVGDARAYLLRFGRLEILTTDDALFADVVTSTKSSLPAKPRGRGVLWRSLGTQVKLEASIAHVELLVGDQLLLCTDGVHRSVSADEICDVLLEADTAAVVTARLLALVKIRGGADNGTVIVGRDLLALRSLPSPRASRFTWKRVSLTVLLVVGTALFLLL